MLILLLWTALCALQDLRARHIGNGLAYAFLAFALGWLVLNGESLSGARPLDALAALVLALALTIPGHIKGVLGGGDVKLLAAIGLGAGTLVMLLVVAGAALLLALWALITRALPASLNRAIATHTPGLSHLEGRLAYGPFVFLALSTLYAFARLS